VAAGLVEGGGCPGPCTEQRSSYSAHFLQVWVDRAVQRRPLTVSTDSFTGLYLFADEGVGRAGRRVGQTCDLRVADLEGRFCALIGVRRVRVCGVGAHGEDRLGGEGRADRAVESRGSREIETPGVRARRSPDSFGVIGGRVVAGWGVLSTGSSRTDRLDHQAVRPDRAALPHHPDPRYQILTAEDPLTPELRDALALIC
jgi:hypothetical protein